MLYYAHSCSQNAEGCTLPAFSRMSAAASNASQRVKAPDALNDEGDACCVGAAATLCEDAEQLLLKAQKKLKNSSSFSLLRMVGISAGANAAKEEAAELYVSAGNTFKAQKEFKKAIGAYEKAAEVFLSIGEKSDGCNALLSAASCAKKKYPEKAVDFFEEAIAIMLQEGRFSTAAKYQKEVAELHESELVDNPKAITNYRRAGELYLGEDSKALASACLFKASKLACISNDLAAALDLFDELIVVNLLSEHAKWLLKEYYVGSSLCILLQRNPAAASKKIQEFCEQDASFLSSREHSLIVALIDAVKSNNVADFEATVGEMDNLMKLDSFENKWKTFLLLRIKEKLEEEPSLI